jgi:hypothetical protein
MGIVRRIERAAEQADAHPRSVRRKHDAGRRRDASGGLSRIIPAQTATHHRISR